MATKLKPQLARPVEPLDHSSASDSLLAGIQTETYNKEAVPSDEPEPAKDADTNFKINSSMEDMTAAIDQAADAGNTLVTTCDPRNAVKLRMFYTSGSPYCCKNCHVQVSASDHLVEGGDQGADKTFLKFELM